MSEPRRRLDQPKAPRGLRAPRIAISNEAVGTVAENIARFFGTARYLFLQTVIVIDWIEVNAIWGLNYPHARNQCDAHQQTGSACHANKPFDPYPFILLNLAFSTQAAYAAPLILLAQNRQDERDRANIERDRQVAARTQADTEYLARELASIRLTLNDLVTNQDLTEHLAEHLEHMEKVLLDREPEKSEED